MFFSPTTLAFLGGEVGPEMLEEMRETNRVLMEVRDLLKQQVSEEGISLLPLRCTREIAGSSALSAGVQGTSGEGSIRITALETRIKRWSHNQIHNSGTEWIPLNSKPAA